MARLAILGHKTRGKEVIEILEMLGGENPYAISTTVEGVLYTISIYDNRIVFCSPTDKFVIFTLEEFLEKFPYKVGDKVSSKYLKNYKIVKMEWEDTNNRVIYKLQGMGWYNSDELEYYKEETMEEKEPEPKAPILSNRYDYAEGKCGYVIPNGYEFDSIKQGFQTEIILRPIKSQYPKTYKECCDVLDIYPIYNKSNLCICEWYQETREMHEHYSKLANLSQKDIAFMILRTCRDAYWKIAGEQMGLEKPWESNPSNEEQHRYAIYNYEGTIVKNDFWLTGANAILVFPTEEMRDAFYENFKELINVIKELL